MHAEQWGSGDVLHVGLHGWSGTARTTFEPLGSVVPAGARLIAFDLPGCGRTPAPREWSMAVIVDEVANEIERLGTPVNLVGNCSGAVIGLFVAQRAPELIQRIVTIDLFAFWPWYFRVFVNRAFGRYAYQTTFANPAGRWIANLSLRSKRRKSTSLTDGFARVDHAVTYRYLEVLRDAGPVEQFCGLQLPVDIAYGERSFKAVSRSAKRLAEMWPNARIFELKGAGHLPIIEATGQLGGIVFSAGEQGTRCSEATTYAN